MVAQSLSSMKLGFANLRSDYSLETYAYDWIVIIMCQNRAHTQYQIGYDSRKRSV